MESGLCGGESGGTTSQDVLQFQNACLDPGWTLIVLVLSKNPPNLEALTLEASYLLPCAPKSRALTL